MHLLSSLCCCFCYWSSRWTDYSTIGMEWILPDSLRLWILWTVHIRILQQGNSGILSNPCNHFYHVNRLQHSLHTIHLPWICSLLHNVRNLNAEAWWEWTSLSCTFYYNSGIETPGCPPIHQGFLVPSLLDYYVYFFPMFFSLLLLMVILIRY